MKRRKSGMINEKYWRVRRIRRTIHYAIKLSSHFFNSHPGSELGGKKKNNMHHRGLEWRSPPQKSTSAIRAALTVVTQHRQFLLSVISAFGCLRPLWRFRTAAMLIYCLEACFWMMQISLPSLSTPWLVCLCPMGRVIIALHLLFCRGLGHGTQTDHEVSRVEGAGLPDRCSCAFSLPER